MIVMEYPGYSIYQGKPTEELINADALLLYKYLVVELGVPPGKNFFFKSDIFRKFDSGW